MPVAISTTCGPALARAWAKRLVAAGAEAFGSRFQLRWLGPTSSSTRFCRAWGAVRPAARLVAFVFHASLNAGFKLARLCIRDAHGGDCRNRVFAVVVRELVAANPDSAGSSSINVTRPAPSTLGTWGWERGVGNVGLGTWGWIHNAPRRVVGFGDGPTGFRGREVEFVPCAFINPWAVSGSRK